MFEALNEQAVDPLLALIAAFRDEGRPDKIDLGVGVYRDEDGRTPVFAAVKAAERILAETQPTKSYLGPEGDRRFVELLAPIVFGASSSGSDRLVGLQTPGGTGALRLASDLVAAAKPGCRIWVGTPTWPNHVPIFEAAGLEVATYAWFDVASQGLAMSRILDGLSSACAGDLVMLHACCHNPTGADPDEAQWKAVVDIIARRGLVPLIDFAYQGLGRGLERDAAGARLVLSVAAEALIAYSCDKNFGLYRERTGALFLKSRSAREASIALGNATRLARVSWSMPPDHGAAVVRTVLESSELSGSWRQELDGMARRVRATREALASRVPDLRSIAAQRGLFALLPATSDEVARLRSEHGIYVAQDGRMNIAGLRSIDIPTVAQALASVCGDHLS